MAEIDPDGAGSIWYSPGSSGCNGTFGTVYLIGGGSLAIREFGSIIGMNGFIICVTFDLVNYYFTANFTVSTIVTGKSANLIINKGYVWNINTFSE